MTYIEKLIEAAKSVWFVATEAVDVTVAQQKQESEDRGAQRLATKEANELEERRKQSAKEVTDAEESKVLA